MSFCSLTARLARLICLVALVAASLPAAGAADPVVGQHGKDVIWVPTPERAVERMLTIAKVGPSDTVIDLGSGDGRIVITAAKQFGARALGVDLNPDLIRIAEQRAAQQGVSDRARFLLRDLFEVDLRPATVITLYLLPELNLKLRPSLLRLAPGTRVVSHAFDMGEWQPDVFDATLGASVRLWIVPARVAGDWTWELPAGRGKRVFEASLSQQFQRVQGLVQVGSRRVRLIEPQLSGTQIAFTLQERQAGKPEWQYRFSGAVKGNLIEGEVTAADRAKPMRWVATRKPQPAEGAS